MSNIQVAIICGTILFAAHEKAIGNIGFVVLSVTGLYKLVTLVMGL